LNCSS